MDKENTLLRKMREMVREGRELDDQIKRLEKQEDSYQEVERLSKRRDEVMHNVFELSRELDVEE